MSKAPIMPFYTDSYLADCHHLSTEAHGAYLLILLHTWRLGGVALADDDAVMMPIVKAKSKPRWRKLRRELSPFFDLSDGTWRQKKLERVWQDVSSKIEQNRKNGKRKNNANATDKSLTSKKRDSATASDSLQPSINHEPINHKPTLDKKGFDMMISASTSPANPAITSLHGILHDPSYFMPQGGCIPPAKLQSKLECALDEAEAQLTPAPSDIIEQLVSRLMMHFPCKESQREQVFSDYVHALSHIPEDILCAAYQHILSHHKYHTLPKVADFITFADPEIAQRKSTKRKVEILLKRLEEDGG